MSTNNSENERITSLADYSALRRFATALWRQDTAFHGAAIMVGAGFSRCAAKTGDANSRLPLWTHFAATLARDIGASSSSDPLRLAEEYCAYFGKQALHDLIKREINDAAWTPGEMYASLLKLPWSEILTTNWDSLLERAANEIHDPVYSLVSRQEDLSSMRTPRIVKLHGTINVTEDLVFTQEDYRKYPQRHAVFVNFARQVFVENELCLLGFSGDDPNFLQWAGWVRDQLTTNARRIYLVGAQHLTAAKRKYLESINVAPIDLWDLVADYDAADERHARATAIFINALENFRPKQPWEWSPTRLHRSSVTTQEMDMTFQDAGHAAGLLERQISALVADRESYPAWLVCPSKVRLELQNQINDPYPSARNISQLSPESRARLLYEIAWRQRVTYELPPTWLIDEFLKVCDPATSGVLSKKQQLEIALHLLKSARWLDDADSERITGTIAAILSKNSRYWPESVNEVAFLRATMARDKFDYIELENLIGQIQSTDPVWKLKKAALLSELGHFAEGELLIAEAYRDLLLQYRNDRRSVFVFSRMAWAHWLSRGVQMWKPGTLFESFPSSYQEARCDPFEHVEHLQERISRALENQRKQQEIEPSFEPGHYKDNSHSVTFSSQLHPLLLLDGISNDAGVPLRWDAVSFLVEPASRLVGMDDVSGMHCFSLAIRAANSDTSDPLKTTFSRIQVACMSGGDADQLLNRCINAVNYWKERGPAGAQKLRRHAINRLRVFLEVLARLVIRATPEQAKSAFRLAIEIGRIPALQHFWLSDSLKHLIEYSLTSIPESQHQELMLDAMLFPLGVEIGVGDHIGWPNPVIEHPGVRGSNAALDRRLDEIIDRIVPCTSASAPALLRLIPLARSGFLSAHERQKMAEKIWGTVSVCRALPETGLFKFVLCELPSPNPMETTKELVTESLFGIENGKLFNPSFLMEISNAAQSKHTSVLPSERQALDLFERLVAWRAKVEDDNPLRPSGWSQKEMGALIGEVLARSVVPSLPKAALTQENFEKLNSFYCAIHAPGALLAFAHFAEDPALTDRLERIVRRGMHDQGSDTVARAAHALLKWRGLTNDSATHRLTSRLIYLIESGRTVGLHGLLWTADQMLGKGWLVDAEIAVLADSIPMIFDSTRYKNVDHASREAISVSFVRAACVKLARNILNASGSYAQNTDLLRVMQEAKQDELPEVRFA